MSAFPFDPVPSGLESRLGEIVDDRVGLVGDLRVVPRRAGEPDFFHVAARAANTQAFVRQPNFRMTGGAATTVLAAANKAVGEAIERYCAAMFDVDDLILSSASELDRPHVEPRAFALYSDEQLASPGFPWAGFGDQDPVRWVEGSDLVSGERILVPAAMVFVPYYYYRGSGDTPIVQPISTGLACHATFEEATVAGLCEVIERDAFTLVWQGGMSVPQVRVETLDDADYDRVRRFEATGGSVVLLDATLDAKVPTIVALLRHSAPAEPALVVSAASDPDPGRAVTKSLDELAHTRRYSRQIKDRMPRISPDEIADVADQLGHLNVWADERNADRAAFLVASKVRRDFEDIEPAVDEDGRLPSILRRIGSTGHRAIAVDITTADVASLGLSVVRGLIPGFHPLFMGHRIRALGGPRLRDIPGRYGPKAAFDGPDIDLPHPFP